MKNVTLAIVTIALGILLPIGFGGLLLVALSLKTAALAATACGFALAFALGMSVGARAAAVQERVVRRAGRPQAAGNAIQSSGLGSSSLPKLRRVY